MTTSFMLPIDFCMADLIVLLMTLTPDDCQIILKNPGKGSTETRLYSIQHILYIYLLSLMKS